MSQALKLTSGLQQAGLDIAADIQQKLLDYLALMQKWNKVHNLTAVRDPDEMVTLHLLDSLVVLPHIQTTGFKVSNLLDVGSGAGLPGIPLALCMPELQVTVMDSSQKKASFMRQAKAELGIKNLEVVSGRVEQFKPPAKFDIVISRAFSDLALFIKLTRHLCAADGMWLAMKGVYPDAELAELETKMQLTPSKIIALEVPALEAQRHLVFFPNSNNEIQSLCEANQ
ncbi:MAG TPA: 16S rRNA (guanine(527)-N(7))-methyltransferase RsmG [Methylophilaceae bacterium]|nr:16S rRNA (guanine(527)-N(7))-methyltransferase RsmG [Methylophilaceae bacterium]